MRRGVVRGAIERKVCDEKVCRERLFHQYQLGVSCSKPFFLDMSSNDRCDSSCCCRSLFVR